MGQFIGCLEGMGEACAPLIILSFRAMCLFITKPVVRGFCQLPLLAVLALQMTTRKQRASALWQRENPSTLLIGETKGHLGQSLFLREIYSKEEASAPPVDLRAERTNGDLVRTMIEDGTITACHDVSDGGVLVALAEMAMAAGIRDQSEWPDNSSWVLVRRRSGTLYQSPATQPDLIITAAEIGGICVKRLGVTRGETFTLQGVPAKVAELVEKNESWLPASWPKASKAFLHRAGCGDEPRLLCLVQIRNQCFSNQCVVGVQPFSFL